MLGDVDRLVLLDGARKIFLTSSVGLAIVVGSCETVGFGMLVPDQDDPPAVNGLSLGMLFGISLVLERSMVPLPEDIGAIFTRK